MVMKLPALTVGLEEELFLVLPSGQLTPSIPAGLLSQCESRYPKQIIHEYLVPQLELVSQPHDTIGELHEELKCLRSTLIETANAFDLRAMASSTHPASSWKLQHANEGERYHRLENALQMVARRLCVGGVHIHVGIEDVALRLKLHNALIPYLPLFLALSTSSPFWRGFQTGMMSYRLSVLENLPRSGLPVSFNDLKTYQQYISDLVNSGVIENAAEIWWDMRLNPYFPTVELRIVDTCPCLEDTMSIASLYQSLVRKLLRSDFTFQTPLVTARWLMEENRWRAQRYPMRELTLFDHQHQMHSFESMLTDLVEALVEDAEALGCADMLTNITGLVSKGSSAEKQNREYSRILADQQGKENVNKLALNAVVNTLVEDTANF